MRYQRTQIYLEPEDHRRLVDEASRRGISLAALLREIVAGHTSETAPRYDAKSWDALIGLADEGEGGDIARDSDALMRAAMEERYRKKLGSP